MITLPIGVLPGDRGYVECRVRSCFVSVVINGKSYTMLDEELEPINPRIGDTVMIVQIRVSDLMYGADHAFDLGDVGVITKIRSKFKADKEYSVKVNGITQKIFIDDFTII